MSERQANGPLLAEVAKPERPRPGESLGRLLLLLFVALGPLALGMLWKNSRLSVRWKVVLTALTAGQLVLVVWLLWYVASWFLASLGDYW